MMETITVFSNTAALKVNQLKNSKSKYFLMAMLAGLFVGLGIILIFTIGGQLDASNAPGTKIIMGISFGIALSLVIMAGADLFTGNNMIMTIGLLMKKTTALDAGRIWVYSYFGNFAGSVLPQIRIQLASVLTAVLSQRLVRRADGKGRKALTELLVNTSAIKNLIRNGKMHQIPSIMQTSRDQGMHTMDMSIRKMIASGTVMMDQVAPFLEERGV